MGNGVGVLTPQKQASEGDEDNNKRYHTIIERASIVWETYSEDETRTNISCDAASIDIDHGLVYVLGESNEILLQLDLKNKPLVSRDETKVIFKTTNSKLEINFPNLEEAARYYDVFRGEVIICSANSSQTIDDIFDQFLKGSVAEDDDDDDEVDNGSSSFKKRKKKKKRMIDVPPMNIVILVVGTRGDVQPFVYFALRLIADGHRVRIATHAEYRQYVMDYAEGAIEFYPLGGDPRKLSEYMVKTGGRLLPDIFNNEEMREIPEKMKMLEEICYSTFPACTAADPEDPDKKPFLADAIISNPVSYGHIHCAECISVPLHIMFPQPWSPTKCFPHPLSNLGHKARWSRRNQISYAVVDQFMWVGLGAMINKFRQEVLHLSPIRSGESGHSLLNDNNVPISHMWSPTFVPKCKDWPQHVDVVGEYTAPVTAGGKDFVPAPALQEWLDAGEKPLYIGFGSMVIENATKLVDTIKSAAETVGCRVLLQSGWTKYGADNELISEEVMVVGAMPHSWLFQNVAGVCHHGGAGTTSAGLRDGNPTFICPFFGDQHFWAEMVNRAGAGPPGCPIGELTPAKLVVAFETMRKSETIAAAKELGAKMAAEDGVGMGKESFYRNLPLSNMICEVSVFTEKKTAKIARVYCPLCGFKMNEDIDKVVHRKGGGREDHSRIPFRPSHWGVVDPASLGQGIVQGLGAASYEAVGGLYDLFAKPIEGAVNNGFEGYASGVATGVTNLFARPAIGGKVLAERLVKGGRRKSANSSLEVEAYLVGVGSKAKHSAGRHVATELQPKEGFSSRMMCRRGEEKGASDSESKTDLLSSSDSAYFLPTDFDSLPQADRDIETAFQKAHEFLVFFQALDVDGNRSIEVDEFQTYLDEHKNMKGFEGTTLDAKTMFATIDTNMDGSLTLAELAWVMRGLNPTVQGQVENV